MELYVYSNTIYTGVGNSTGTIPHILFKLGYFNFYHSFSNNISDYIFNK